MINLFIFELISFQSAMLTQWDWCYMRLFKIELHDCTIRLDSSYRSVWLVVMTYKSSCVLGWTQSPFRLANVPATPTFVLGFITTHNQRFGINWLERGSKLDVISKHGYLILYIVHRSVWFYNKEKNSTSVSLFKNLTLQHDWLMK